MSGSIKPCLFCGAVGVKLTKEHVYPRWLSRFLSPAGPDEPVTAWWNDRQVRQMRGLDVKVGGVCAACNQGWMHDLEAAFRLLMSPSIHGVALVKGPPILLDRGEQKVVAAWAVKTWLLLELALEHVRGAVKSADALRYLYAHGEPPDVIQVFLGVTPDPLWRSPSQLMMVTLPRPPAPPAGALALLTIGVLALYFYVPAVMGGVRLAEQLEIRGPHADALAQIWPYQVAEVRWPTPAILSHEAIKGIFL